MPAVSKKGKLMPQSPIRKLVPFSEKALKAGKNIYHLNIGQPDIKTPEIALNAVRNSTLDILAYSRSEGSEVYREKIADYYAKKGEHYFYDLLKHLTTIENLTPEDYIDWGTTEKYKKEIEESINIGDEFLAIHKDLADIVNEKSRDHKAVLKKLDSLKDREKKAKKILARDICSLTDKQVRAESEESSLRSEIYYMKIRAGIE